MRLHECLREGLQVRMLMVDAWDMLAKEQVCVCVYASVCVCLCMCVLMCALT